MPTLAELAGYGDDPSTTGGGLLGLLTSFIDNRKRGLLNNVQGGPGLLGTRINESARDFNRDNRQWAGAEQSVIPELRDMAGQRTLNQALNAGGLLGLATVWHGSPKRISEFDPAKAGTGSGSSLGLGHNVSADKGHSKAYMGDSGYLHKVDLADEAIPQMIVWEKPVPKTIAKQVPKVDMSKPMPLGGGGTVEKVDGQWKLKTAGSNTAFNLHEAEVRRMFDGDTGEQVYRRLVAHHGGDERAASEWLRSRGVPGISNTTERSAQNYVVFPGMEKYLKILGVE
jgi:hypothetical protein